MDTPDELALRSLLLGITYRTIGNYELSRSFLLNAHAKQPSIRVSTWIGGVAMFELAVLDLKEIEWQERRRSNVPTSPSPSSSSPPPSPSSSIFRGKWLEALDHASEKLDQTMLLATSSTDLSSRLDSRVAMLRGEIALKKELLGAS